jgi:hypothetical protein
MVADFQVATACSKSPYYFSKLYNSILIKKFLATFSQATISNHSKIFTLILLLSEAQADEAQEPYNKRMLFLVPPRGGRGSFFSPQKSHMARSLRTPY